MLRLDPRVMATNLPTLHPYRSSLRASKSRASSRSVDEISFWSASGGLEFITMSSDFHSRRAPGGGHSYVQRSTI